MAKIIGVIFLGIFLVSCFPGFNEPLIEVIDGNAKFATGNYNEATISYLKARRLSGGHSLINYNIGNVYYALGETSASIDELKVSLETKNRELKYRGFYNLGIIYFEQNQYLQAINQFKDALRIKPKDIDSKVNLELAIIELEKQNSLEQEESSRQEAVPLSIEEQKVFELIQKKEEKIWKTLVPESSPSSAEDW